MKKFLIAVAMGAALPSAAYAQAEPAPPKMECCEKMKVEGRKCCCADMDEKNHAEHDKGETDHGARWDR